MTPLRVYNLKMHAWRYTLIIIFIVLIDQFSKGAIQSLLQIDSGKQITSSLTLVYQLKGGGILFSLLLVWMLIWSIYKIIIFRKESFMRGFPYAMLVCGSIGNLLDIYLYGSVVNIFQLYLGSSYIKFNIADASLVSAAILIAVNFLQNIYRIQDRSTLSES